MIKTNETMTALAIWWWTLKMAIILWDEGCCHEFRSAYRYAKDDCWQDMRREQFTPGEAWQEDMHADY